MSAKRLERKPERDQVRETVLQRARYRCEAFLTGCTLSATDVHEIKSRGRWREGIYEPSNCLALCRRCHDFITDNPDFATENGFSVSSTAGEAEFARVAALREVRARRDGRV